MKTYNVSYLIWSIFKLHLVDLCTEIQTRTRGLTARYILEFEEQSIYCRMLLRSRFVIFTDVFFIRRHRELLRRNRYRAASLVSASIFYC